MLTAKAGASHRISMQNWLFGDQQENRNRPGSSTILYLFQYNVLDRPSKLFTGIVGLYFKSLLR
jgi:hypothetical protein